MAAFEGFQGSNESRFSPTVYGYSFSNSESVVDKSNIQFSMWKTTIKISISPLIDTGTNEWRVDRKNAISAYLIPAKAMMFANILKRYKEDPEKYNNWGVASGSAYISVINPKSIKPDAEGFAIINIRRISTEGVVEASYSYEVKAGGTYNAVIGFDEKKGTFSQDFDTYAATELDLIAIQLMQYAKAMSNAVAFTVTNNQYDYLDKIAQKVGADFSGGYAKTYTNQSYFSQSGAQQQQSVQPPMSAGLESLIGQ
jgi:hypothetical protein